MDNLREIIKNYIRENYGKKEEVDEISTSAGAGAYNTKYAFRLPKGYKKTD